MSRGPLPVVLESLANLIPTCLLQLSRSVSYYFQNSCYNKNYTGRSPETTIVLVGFTWRSTKIALWSPRLESHFVIVDIG
jgi:hypothetical protein